MRRAQPWVYIILLALFLIGFATAHSDTPTSLEPRDDRVPLLRAVAGSTAYVGTATLISTTDTQSFYLTNHHMLKSGAAYTLITSKEEIAATCVGYSRDADLAVLAAVPSKLPPLRVAAKAPPNNSLVGVHGWTHGKLFGIQEGYLKTINDKGWFEVSVGANQGQSGGPIMHKGQIVGLVSGTNDRSTCGPGVTTIRKFLNWK